MWVGVFAVWCVCVLVAQTMKASFGPWRGIMNQVGPCVDTEYKDLSPAMSFNVQKNGKYGRYLTEGELDAKFGITNQIDMAAVVNEFKNKKWHTIVNHEVGGVCQAMNKRLPTVWKLLVDNMENVTSFKIGEDVCVPSGKLTVKPFELPPIDLPRVPTFFYGDYVLETLFFHPNKTKIACTAFYVSVVPLGDMKG